MDCPICASAKGLKDRQELVQHMEIRSDNPDLVIENIADYISARENHYCKCEAKNISKILQNVYLKLPAIDPSKCVIRLADMINANERAKRLAEIMMNEIVNEEISAEESVVRNPE